MLRPMLRVPLVALTLIAMATQACGSDGDGGNDGAEEDPSGFSTEPIATAEE